jgi:hypothetical protein
MTRKARDVIGNRVNVVNGKVDPLNSMKTQRESGGVVLIFL